MIYEYIKIDIDGNVNLSLPTPCSEIWTSSLSKIVVLFGKLLLQAQINIQFDTAILMVPLY